MVMLPEDIRERAALLNLDKKALAALAGISERWTGVILRGEGNPRLDNLRALGGAIIAKEIAERDRLLSLHPLSAAPVIAPASHAPEPADAP